MIISENEPSSCEGLIWMDLIRSTLLNTNVECGNYCTDGIRNKEQPFFLS